MNPCQVAQEVERMVSITATHLAVRLHQRRLHRLLAGAVTHAVDPMYHQLTVMISKPYLAARFPSTSMVEPAASIFLPTTGLARHRHGALETLCSCGTSLSLSQKEAGQHGAAWITSSANGGSSRQCMHRA